MPQEESTLRVLIADDHRVWTEGLKLSLERHGLQTVNVVYDGRHIMEACLADRPDVVLLDIMLPGRDGLNVLSEMREQVPDITVMILTGAADPTLPRRAYELGADGFLSKETTAEKLAQKVRNAHAAHKAGELPDAPTVEASEIGHIVDLTRTERKVLRMMAQGLDNAAIAKRMTVSQNTVKTHVSNVLSKLEVPNRTLAALWAIEHGYSK